MQTVSYYKHFVRQTTHNSVETPTMADRRCIYDSVLPREISLFCHVIEN